MDIWQKLKGELVDIIEWLDQTNDTLLYRFPRMDNEIKYGAKLIVREGQVAVFVNEGQIADVFTPGTYTLQTENLPILSTLRGWKYGFHSPFKAEVYFASTRRFTNLKWGTKNPVMLRDAEFGPVRLRSFGTYVIQMHDAGVFVRQVAGTIGSFKTEDITEQLRNIIVARFADILGESKIPVLDLASNYDELGKFLTTRISPDFQGYGLDLIALLVENISLPEDVEKALDQRSSMGVIGDLSRFTQYQTAQAIRDAAQNPGSGGTAGAGMGMGMGFAMANQMSQSMAAQSVQPPARPVQGAGKYFIAVNGQQTGPFDVQGLQQQARSGQLTRETLLWTQGMSGWTAAAEVPEIAGILAAVPPPVPRA
jgi:membrane protease subunit (stomatin/prohibitin family)